MSRAFTRESDDAEAFRLPDRPISGAPNLVTQRGADLISSELGRIDRELQAGTGDRDALRRDRRYWSARQASMQVVAPIERPTSVSFGVRVRIRRARKVSELRIVGEDEASPQENLIAWTSPLAVALDGAEAGETVELEAGGRIEQVEVLAVLP